MRIKWNITFESFSLSDANDINHFVLGENLLDGNLLLEMFASPVNFVGNGAAVKLDFHDVGLLLASLQQLLLSVAEHTDDLAIFLNLRQFFLNLFLADFILPLGASLGKGLLLGLGPLFCQGERSTHCNKIQKGQDFIVMSGSLTPKGFIEFDPRGNLKLAFSLKKPKVGAKVLKQNTYQFL